MNSTSVAAVLADRHLIVTGATGFVGKVWLSHLLLHAPEVGRITLLVRPGRHGARRRVEDQFERSPAFRPLRDKLGEDLSDFLDARVRVVEGELDAEHALPALDAADAVVHIAGLTDFDPDPLAAVRTNVDGARRAADLAARYAAGRLLHVSTCYVAGERNGRIDEDITVGVSPKGKRFDPEDEISRLHGAAQIADKRMRRQVASDRARALGWPNLYTFTKALAEHVLAARADLRLTVVRPSIVESATAFPFPGWNEGMNTSGPMIWYTATAFTGLPARAENRFDVVPVDAVAAWMTVALAALIRGDHAPVYQLSTSGWNPTTMGRILDLNSLAIRRHHHGAPEASPLRRHVLRHLDVSAVAWEGQGVFSPRGLRKMTSFVKDALGEIAPDRALPRALRAPATALHERAVKLTHDAEKALKRVERLLELYRPFIHDNDWEFRADATRAALSRLLPADAPFAYDAATIDWRRYWVDIHMPGIVKWSLPLFDGHEAPLDPCVHRVHLQARLPRVVDVDATSENRV